VAPVAAFPLLHHHCTATLLGVLQQVPHRTHTHAPPHTRPSLTHVCVSCVCACACVRGL
jgi:hypothetical protein